MAARSASWRRNRGDGGGRSPGSASCPAMARAHAGPASCPSGPLMIAVRVRARSASVHGKPLGDRPAEGRPGDVRGVDMMPVEHGEGVGRQVGQGVGLSGEIHAGRTVLCRDGRIGSPAGPPETSVSTSPSGHPIPCAEVPIISRTAGSTGHPGSFHPQTHLTGGDELFFGQVHG